VISALPFAVLAYSDDNWRSADAAPLCLTAWLAVFGAYSVKYGAQCPCRLFSHFSRWSFRRCWRMRSERLQETRSHEID